MTPRLSYAIALNLVWVVQTLIRPLLTDLYTWQWGIAVSLSGVIAGLTGVCYYLWWINR